MPSALFNTSDKHFLISPYQGMSRSVFESVKRAKRAEFMKILIARFFKIISKYNIIKVITI